MRVGHTRPRGLRIILFFINKDMSVTNCYRHVFMGTEWQNNFIHTAFSIQAYLTRI